MFEKQITYHRFSPPPLHCRMCLPQPLRWTHAGWWVVGGLHGCSGACKRVCAQAPLLNFSTGCI
eukprot:3786318-Alexandrium_andersonii.AAC.1